MPTDALSDAAVKAAKPKAKPYKLADGRGLYLLVTATAKRWCQKFRHEGKEQVLSHGLYPGVSLKEARALRDVALVKIGQGINPNQEKQAAKRAEADAEQAAIVAENSTLAALIRDWLERNRGEWKPATTAKAIKITRAYLLPQLGSSDIRTLTAPVLHAHIDAIQQAGKIETASKVLQYLSQIFRLAIITGRADVDHAAPLKGAIKTREVQNQKAVQPAELGALVRAVRGYGGDPAVRIGLELCLLTNVRTVEIRGARWDEFDLERAGWQIPATRMKMDKPHWVPLSRQALKLVAELRQHTGEHALLFPGERDKSKSISENTLLYALWRCGYHGKATVHGFRSTFSTAMNELGLPERLYRESASP
jgi:integrase